jgi:hypothetical protein
MMKKILTFTLLPAALSLTSTSVLAHGGHLPNESVHGLLHVEHIVGLIAFAVIVFTVTMWNKK